MRLCSEAGFMIFKVAPRSAFPRRKVAPIALPRIAFIFCAASSLRAQSKLSPKWQELTAPDFRQGIQQAKGTCLLPFGILEKHGPHLPLGTDLLNVRYASLPAASHE